MIVVAALDTNEIEEDQLHTYKPASFTNTGTKSVDIFAPGTNISAAAFGGGTIAHSGTSMASPYLLNHGVLSLAKKYPLLSNEEIKEIILRSAYINLKNPLPVLSGGILFPRRAIATAAIYLTEKVSIRDASLIARKRGVLAPHETFTEKNESLLLELWHNRGL